MIENGGQGALVPDPSAPSHDLKISRNYSEKGNVSVVPSLLKMAAGVGVWREDGSVYAVGIARR